MRRGQHDWLPESDRPQGLHWHNTRETAQRLHGCRARSSYRQSLLLDGTESRAKPGGIGQVRPHQPAHTLTGPGKSRELRPRVPEESLREAPAVCAGEAVATSGSPPSPIR